MKKCEMRAMMKNRLAALDPEERAAEEAALISRILAHPLWQKAKNVFCYISFDFEINTYPFLQSALAQGKILSAPKVIGKGIMEARQITDLSALQTDCYGIACPSRQNALVKAEDIALAVVPGLAFDPVSLLRLGRGGGYYDRFLANCGAYRLAPALACQMVNGRIPREINDLEMDMVVTAKSVYAKEKESAYL